MPVNTTWNSTSIRPVAGKRILSGSMMSPDVSMHNACGCHGRPCEIWTSPPSSDVPLEVCLTLDGIPLKAKAVTTRGKSVSFEATELERLPQDPALFEVPKGVKVRRVPRGMENMIPGLNPY